MSVSAAPPRARARTWGVVALLAAACEPTPWPDPPPIDAAVFLAEHEAWRERRRSELADSAHASPRWVGLWPLSEGVTPFGADTSLPIVLPARAVPWIVGEIERRGPATSLTLEPGLALTLHDGSVTPSRLELKSDSAGEPTCLRVGSLHVWVHNERGRLYVRATDESRYAAVPGRFSMPAEFPPDLRWRVAAKLERFRTARMLRLPDVTGEIQEWQVPGHLVFRIQEREFRALPVALPAEPGSSLRMRLMFRDSTSGRETYGLMRYVTVPPVDSTGWTVIDFNRSYSPPCAFTAHSVCVLPPQENRLAVAIRAGEKRFL